MDESSDEPEARKPSLRKRVGVVLFWIGLIIVAISSIPTIASALGTSVSNYAYLVDFMLIGIIIAIFGLAAALFPDGQPRKGVWIMMMSPFWGS
ncbi:hypothetical protein EU528_04580 [Candidatus Thorarchaeota archaeon]|nr:MAG: hypothetical protein EU528_04580 [Candidatus Thorarchaeota archaeon]